MRKLLPIFLCLTLLSGCAHYSTADGIRIIATEPVATKETKLSLIAPSPVVDGDGKTETPTEESDALRGKTSAPGELSGNLAEQVAELQAAIAALKEENATLKNAIAALTGKSEEPDAALPPLSEITYPKTYRTGKTRESRAMEAVTVLLLPLGSGILDEEAIAEIAGGISGLGADIIIATGERENTYLLTRCLNESAVLTEEGAIITDYPLAGDADESGMTVALGGNRTLRLSAADLPQSDVAEAFLANGDWQAVVEGEKKERLDAIDEALKNDSSSQAAIFGASLYEPSSSDWNAFSPVDYRRVGFAWPLSDAILAKGYHDTYRQTHLSGKADAGDTLRFKTLKERTDFLFAKHVLPLSSSVVAIGPEPSGRDGLERKGVVAKYLIP